MADRQSFGDFVQSQPRQSFGDFVGAAPPSPSGSVGDAVAHFAKNFWGEMTGAGQGMVDMFTHNPLDTVKGMGAAQDAIRLKAQDAMKRGDFTEAARHAINYLIPLIGPSLDARGDQAQRGDVSGALGGTTAIGAQMFGPSALESAVTAAPRVASAVRTAADATKAAVKAGAKDVAVGGVKTATGVALAKAGPLGEIADVIAGIPIVKSGLKQMGQGVRAGFSAGKQTLTPPPAEFPPGAMGILSPDYFDRLRLPPGPAITPPPPPPESYVRSVPAMYPTGPNPARALPAPPAVIVPEAPPLPPDTSLVRAVPAQYPEVIPPTLRENPAAADLAGQLETSMRVETIADYLARNKIPNSMLESFGDKEWKMIADQAGVRPPSKENIQAIRSNLAEYEGAAELTAKTPAEAKAEFEQKREIRNRRKGPAAATQATPAATPAGAEAAGVPEPWRGTAPAEGLTKPTASELRIEKLAQHLAAEKGISVESLAGLAEQPEALLQFERLAKALGEARPAPDDIPQIIDRMRQLREGQAPPATGRKTQ
jgi:hypothetical protein